MLFNYVNTLLNPNIFNQNSSGYINENNKQLLVKTNSNSAITKTDRENLEFSNNAYLQNCNKNNETNFLNITMSITSKLSIADSF